MPLAALGPEGAKRAVALPKSSCPSLPGSHTHPLPDLWTPARSVWRILLPLHPLALSAPSSKSSPFAQTHSSVLRTFWGLQGRATDQPTLLISLAHRHVTTALTLNANHNPPLWIPHLPPVLGVFCFPLQPTTSHKGLPRWR